MNKRKMSGDYNGLKIKNNRVGNYNTFGAGTIKMKGNYIQSCCQNY